MQIGAGDEGVDGSDEVGGEPVAADKSVISSVEETALAVDALASVWLAERNQRAGGGVESDCAIKDLTKDFEGSEVFRGDFDGPPRESGANHAEIETKSHSGPFDNAGAGKSGLAVAIIRGVEFLIDSVEEDRQHVAWPIGFYFAKLWYYEKLYPLIYSTAALGKFLRATADQVESDWPR